MTNANHRNQRNVIIPSKPAMRNFCLPVLTMREITQHCLHVLMTWLCHTELLLWLRSLPSSALANQSLLVGINHTSVGTSPLTPDRKTPVLMTNVKHRGQTKNMAILLTHTVATTSVFVMLHIVNNFLNQEVRNNSVTLKSSRRIFRS